MREQIVEGRQGKEEKQEARGAPPPSYRNLRVWIESFDLALDIFQVARRLHGAEGRTLTRRLIDSSCRMPVALARGQSSGSATEFIRCLHEGLSELSELETHLLMCAELGYLTAEQVRGYESRTAEIRKMVGGLIRRLRSSTAQPRDGAAAERGSALLAALLVSALLGVLGLGILQIADSERRIAERGRDRDGLLQVAETGARAVKRWFDAPISGDPSSSATVRHAFLARYDLRDPAHFIRSRRLIDADGNATTWPLPADGSAGRELHRQGREILPGLSHLDLFQKPFRTGTVLSFLGTEEGPDLVLEDTPGTVDLLDELNAALFKDQQAVGRLERIEIHAPPTAPAGSLAARLGVATVKVTAARYPALDRSRGIPQIPAGSRPIARAVVRMGLAEIPTNAPRGPLESCGDLVSRGPLRARWGRVIAAGDITLPDELDRLHDDVASSFPYASFGRHITGTAPGEDLSHWLGDPDDSVEDPWLKVVAGGDLIGWRSLPDQPFPYHQSLPIDIDHSNLFQRVAGVTCPAFDYGLWKSVALGGMPGDRHTHYFVFDPATGLFKETGQGAARSVREWTHGRSGIFFFDTVDGGPPSAANLTPEVAISGGEWSTAGVIYLNAASFRASSVRGAERVLLPPGEPFDDADHDLVADPEEVYVNLRYATTLGSGTPSGEMLQDQLAAQSGSARSPDGEVYSRWTTTGRDPKGIPIVASVNLFGVLFNSGDIIAEGDAVTFGSLVAGGAVTQSAPRPDTPWIYFDERLNTGEWPPPEIAMPRTFITFWQTSHP